MIVVDSIHDAFLERLSDAVMSLRLGTADDPATQVGPVIDARAKQRILEYLEIGRREGRVLVDRSAEAPGIFGRSGRDCGILNPLHRLAQEEIFGPILAVMRRALILIRR